MNNERAKILGRDILVQLVPGLKSGNETGVQRMR